MIKLRTAIEQVQLRADNGALLSANVHSTGRESNLNTTVFSIDAGTGGVDGVHAGGSPTTSNAVTEK